MPDKVDLKDKIFGRLTVVGFSHREKGKYLWLCKCDCGNEIVTRADGLKSGHAKSCGCFKYDRHGIKNPNYKHGFKHTRLYNIWIAMHERCENPKADNFKYYGARGISICTEWHDAATFLKWATENGYRDNLSIDRHPNNDGNYEPSNCRWATQKEQVNNSRKVLKAA
jgi:hypothetical protein